MYSIICRMTLELEVLLNMNVSILSHLMYCIIEMMYESLFCREFIVKLYEIKEHYATMFPVVISISIHDFVNSTV